MNRSGTALATQVPLVPTCPSDGLTYWARWHRANHARFLEWHRAYREKHREHIAAQARTWQLENQERMAREPSRNKLYRKLRRNGIERLEAARVAGVTLAW